MGCGEIIFLDQQIKGDKSVSSNKKYRLNRRIYVTSKRIDRSYRKVAISWLLPAPESL